MKLKSEGSADTELPLGATEDPKQAARSAIEHSPSCIDNQPGEQQQSTELGTSPAEDPWQVARPELDWNNAFHQILVETNFQGSRRHRAKDSNKKADPL